MADTWEASVLVGSVTHTAPTTNLYGIILPLYTFVALDIASTQNPAIRITREISSNQWRTREEHGFVNFLAAPYPFFANTGGTFTGSLGDTTFTTGGTLKITKDEAFAKYIWQGLLGTSERTFADIGTITNGELAPSRLELRNTTVQTSPDGFVFTTHSTILSVPFSNLYGKQNGTNIKGASLASADRGSWMPSGSAVEPWTISAGPNSVFTAPDTASAIVGRFDCNVVSGASTDGVASRRWDQTVYLAGMDPSGPSIDMTRAREHGVFWAVYVYQNLLTQVKYRVTYDKGGQWSEGIVYNQAGTDNKSPNINWCLGKLYVVWYNGTSIVQKVSSDLGNSWGPGVVLALTGKSPRHLVDPATGFSWYFYIDGTDLKLRRSGDFGASWLDASPITVATAIGVQTVAAQIAMDGSLLVAYIVANTWTQRRSTDLGRTWGA